MIEFTIKTLDSNNHHFSVDDEITVQQLKEKVREQMGIEINLQRLIFCGRVLQDEKKLSEYDVNGKVVHLVQRAPPGPETRQSATPSSNASNPAEGNTNMQQQIRRLMALGPPDFILEQQHAMSLSPTTGRLDFIRRMIAEIKTSLATLRAHVDGEENRSAPATSEATVGPMDNETPSGATQEEPEPQLDENGDESPDPTTRIQNARRRSYRAIRALRARHTRPRDLGQLIEELETLQEQFAPYRANYVRMLRAANNPEPPQFTDEERQSAQRTVDMVSDIMHSFAHAYHAVSDINFQVGQRNPRLTSEATVVRHPIPMQAHINVVQSNRRPPQQQQQAQQQQQQQQPSQQQPQQQPQPQQGNNTNANSGAPAPQPNATENNANTNAQGQPTAQAGRNAQPTVNINVQPDPITYQVEIETRVPIAFPLENALLNGLTNAAAVVNNQEQNQPNQPQNGTGAQAGQANRRQVLLDFENLFRGLSQTGGLGGVEVVMSMEEIPHAGTLGMGTIVTGNNNNAGATLNSTAQPPNAADGGVYLAANPWGGPPSADLLQNIVSSVIRQGLVPGVEGVTLHIPPGQGQVHPIQVPMAPGPQGTQGAQGPQGQQQPTATQPTQDQNNPNTQNTQPSLHLRRATTTTRAQLSLANLIYDRFLQCDSPHARRRLQRRREQHQHQIAAQERLRAERAAAQNIETLRERNSNMTENYIQTLVRLLNSAPSEESWLNAMLVTVARHLFLADPMQAVAGEPQLVPNEFQQLRMLLRNYVQNLLTRSGTADGENAFLAVSDFFVSQHADFINNMHNITPLREDLDVYCSIRGLVRSRLPAVVASVMSDSSGEMFAARFYSVFSRLFTDFCTLVSHCCQNGVEGLRAVFRAYVEEAVQGFDESIRQMLLTLATENLNGVVNNLASNFSHIQQYIQRREGVIVAPPPESEQPVPMEVSSPASSREEPMQTSPPATPAVNSDNQTTSTAEDVDGPAAPITRAASAMRASTSSLGSAPVHTVTSATAPQSPVSSPSRTKINKEKSEPSTPTRNTSDQNIRFVPPMVILQHWGEEWVPVFTRDQQAQRPEPQEPYSDAYLSGMPSRKRRCVRQARPPTTLDGFMNESVREAADRERSSTMDNSAIRIAFREHMRNMARNRASSSEDYDPARYTSAARFLNTSKSNKPQPQENGSVNKDDE